MPPQFQILAFEVLLVCTGTAIWLKMAWPLLPPSCTGAVALQFKDNAKRIKPYMTKFLILLSCLVFNVRVDYTNLLALADPDLVCPSALSALNEPSSDGLAISKDTTYNTVPLAGTTAILMLLPDMTPLLVAH